MYLGENIYINLDVWETSLSKNDSKFVRDMMEAIWGKETLKKRCLQEKRANKNLSPALQRQALSLRKYNLLKGNI